jgi:SAM-dependent methyltransferase
MDQPAAMAHIEIYEAVAEALADSPRGDLLDVPAGEGALAKRLIDSGFRVTCADLYPQIFKLADVEVAAADLDAKLPFDSDSFDIVVCIEGLEHIENPANAIREFSRLTRSGGELVVSVPNIMNIEERLKWLFSGYTSHFKPLSQPARERVAKEFPNMDEIALHVNPIGYSELRYLLETNGYTIERMLIDKPKRNSWSFLPLVGLIRLVALFSSAERKKERWTEELNSDEVLLGGNTLIAKARKI